MDFKEYQKLAMTTLNPTLNSEQRIMNAILGLNGEAGEVADVMKKHLFQGHDLNKEKLIDEVGDIMWYVALLADGLGVTMEDFAEVNVAKLKKRYPEGFSADKSINRKN